MSSLILKLVNQHGHYHGFKIRGTLDHDEIQWFSVFDTINFTCGKTEKSSYGNTTFFRLIQEGSDFKDEVLTLCKNMKFPGKGQRETPCMTIRGLQRLIMILGGKVAASFREVVEGTFTRVMAGDQSLIEVINANAASEEPVQQAYRAALEQEPVEPVLDELCLKRKRERDDILFDMEIAERKLALEQSQLLLEERKAALEERKEAKLIEHTAVAMKTINDLKSWANVDERTKLQAEDHIKNVLFNKLSAGKQLAITDGDSGTNQTDALNVSILAKELGFKPTDGQLIKIGRDLAKKYRETYKIDPPKHKQFVKGNFVPVNSYMERDRGIMELVIRSVMSKPDVTI